MRKSRSGSFLERVCVMIDVRLAELVNSLCLERDFSVNFSQDRAYEGKSFGHFSTLLS